MTERTNPARGPEEDRLPDDADPEEVAAMTPGERVALTWRMSAKAWRVSEDSRMDKRVVRIIRRNQDDAGD